MFNPQNMGKALRWFNQIIAMLNLSIRILQCCNSHSFPCASQCFFIPSRMASEADLLKLNTVGFELMRLLWFIDVGKCIIHGALLEFFSVSAKQMSETLSVSSRTIERDLSLMKKMAS